MPPVPRHSSSQINIFAESNGLKQIFLILVLMSSICGVMAQADSQSRPARMETAGVRQQAVVKRADTLVRTQVATITVDSAMQSRLTDSLLQDSLRRDSLAKAAQVLPPVDRIDTSTYARYRTGYPFAPMDKPAVYMNIEYRERASKDDLFYVLTGLVFLLAFVKVAFPRYFRNIFILIFQTSLRQKQTRDQLLQDNLASLFTNLLFVISMGLYGAIVVGNKGLASISFWWVAVYGAALLLVVYTGKFLFLQFSGWVFNSREAASAYIFIVFLVNKVIGIVLIPFLLLLAFTGEPAADVVFTVSLAVIGLLLIYRYLISFGALRSNLKVNALHFFLYLCAVEVLPILLIYKLLVNYIDGRF
ncbi:protein of unknown function [Sediminibacterium ginsengisoli]|uniref:DUF4271 domain-containing protein n=1 Tax=Sediminibacterium ginsengisoli TaxID=413434 RepID=A0A1T4JVN3_9BACT|nr:protein of unknown function [Sediminibacterium ginsengisoli]